MAIIFSGQLGCFQNKNNNIYIFLSFIHYVDENAISLIYQQTEGKLTK